MRIAFILDPLDSLRTYKDSSYVMMRECAARGHDVWEMQQGDLAWANGRVMAHARHLRLTGDEADWYEITGETESPLDGWDAVVMRKDPPFDMEYVFSTYLLELAEAQGACVLNSPRAIRDHSEKLAIAQFARFTAPTLVTRRESAIRAFHAEHGDIVVKPLDGMGGASVFRIRRDDFNLGVIIETLTARGTRFAMAQRFIPEIVDGDKRVLVIGGKPVPYALARIPMAGENRGNLAAGGRGVAQPLSPRDREIAEALGPVLAARGLLLVGLDIIGEHLTEVNVTSPTCFREIMDQTGCNVAGLMIDAVEAAARARGSC
jgi:glutathione synthase